MVYEASVGSASDRVAVKEFLPAFLPCRTSSHTPRVAPRPADAASFDAGLRAFYEESDRLAKVSHPNVIQVLDIVSEHGTAYLVMPLERGGTLQPLMTQRRRPSDRQLIGWVAAAAEGAGALHAHGLLHLDIKPSNLWLRPDGRILVLDLGASRWRQDIGDTAARVRTPGYAAPEQYGRARARLTTATDVYALGATLWALAEGTTPPESNARIYRDMAWRYARLGQRSARMMAIVDRAMDLDPTARWPTPDRLRAALLSVPDAGDRPPQPHECLPSSAPRPPIEHRQHS